MPELAEVEFYRRRWDGGLGHRITAVHVHAPARVFRSGDGRRIAAELTGATLVASAAAAKQMLFRVSGGRWLGVHLGMSGELRAEPGNYLPGRHDHLVLAQRARCLVFSDPRMFGRIDFARGRRPPPWWTRLAPPILSDAFSVESLARFLRRRGRAPIKAVLLMQQCFPGVGNWMADEILWRAAIHPRRRAGSLKPAEVRALWRECRRVCRQALITIAGQGAELPPALNARIPRSWLFLHRWEDGGRCPRTGAALRRAAIGGRTTCWSPARQKLRAGQIPGAAR
jgi:formamidopyrimidine-DNA glycosylase